jgi:hypothetical protein
MFFSLSCLYTTLIQRFLPAHKKLPASYFLHQGFQSLKDSVATGRQKMERNDNDAERSMSSYCWPLDVTQMPVDNFSPAV